MYWKSLFNLFVELFYISIYPSQYLLNGLSKYGILDTSWIEIAKFAKNKLQIYDFWCNPCDLKCLQPLLLNFIS